MIKKMRKKIILTALLAVFALLFVLLLAINFTNFSFVSDDADRVTKQIMEQGGSFSAGGGPAGGRGGPFGPESPEISHSTRYFTVALDAAGNARTVAFNISRVTEEEATAWAKSLAGGKVGWTRTCYRFRVWQNGGDTYVTVIDQSRELRPSFVVLTGSCIGGAVGLLVTFFVLLPVSAKLVKPLEESDRRQKRFIADAAYELKNPITVIDTNKSVLELTNGENAETKAIGREVERLIALTKGLDQLVGLDGGDPSLFKEFDLSSLVAEIAVSYAESFAKAGKTLETDVEAGILYNGDAVKIGKLINAALENALKYGETQATVSLKRTEERITFEVKNDAKNVAEGSLDSVFERFYRSEEVRNAGIDGAGVGLSVAKEIVDFHKGRILAKGEKGFFVLKAEL